MRLDFQDYMYELQPYAAMAPVVEDVVKRDKYGPAPRNFGLLPNIRQMKYKVGRNEACPCGSGLKFKACCVDLRTNERRVRLTLLPSSEGRLTGVQGNYTPHGQIAAEGPQSPIFLRIPKLINPGESGYVAAMVLHNALEIGATYNVQEGGRLIGKIEILS